MSWRNCDVASWGTSKKRYEGGLFCRVAINLQGQWVAVDTHDDGTVFLVTSEDHERPSTRYGRTLCTSPHLRERISTLRGRLRNGIRLDNAAIDLGPRYPNNPCYPYWSSMGGLFILLVVFAPGVGRKWAYDPATQKLVELPNFDASGSGSQGFLDASDNGIVWWADANAIELGGQLVRSPLTRSGRTVCVPQSGFNGVVVFDHQAQQFFKAYEGDVQLLPRISDDGEVAVSADPGGYVAPETWLTRPWLPDVTHNDAPHTDAPHTDGPVLIEPSSLIASLVDLRNQYPDVMTSDQCVEMLNTLVWTAPDKGWRLFAKPGGAGGTRYDGVRCSHDFLVHTSGWCVDALGNAGSRETFARVVKNNTSFFRLGNSVPQWGPRLQVHENDEDNQSRWVPPIQPQFATHNDAPHTDVPVGNDQIEQMLLNLAKVVTDQAKQIKELQERHDHVVEVLKVVDNDIAALEALKIAEKFLVLENRLAQPIKSTGKLSFSRNISVEGEVAK